MHDPLTVAHEIKNPFKSEISPLGGRRYRPTLVTIWHLDPEKDGSDDSCDWFGRKRKLNAKEKAIFDAMWALERILDNRPYYPDDPAHKAFQPLKDAVRQLSQREGFRIHPRWHIWHWRIQIIPLQNFKRWAWSRCCRCGRGFKWGESPTSGSWNGTGPRWFRSEKNIWHSGCGNSPTALKPSPSEGNEK